ncbi:head-tail connector protein [Pseudomonas fluorescens]|uniref:Phage gp6-like head-tail connector protein n=1 Tax=Pseudomonas fluorescens TaxID=294 RepID=A0A5E6RP61_PSEFL|nr:head-tail connector protein [Pseudomonas fluorescens]VVM66605.1 hypothetical protein PS652_01557 [Pseudomonas fluorescens]
MSVISIPIARQHLRDPDDDDQYLELLLDAAEDQAMRYLNRRFYADTDALNAAVRAGEAGESPIVINASVIAACLLILGHLYANREDEIVGTATSVLSNGSRALLTPYRVGWGV